MSESFYAGDIPNSHYCETTKTIELCPQAACDCGSSQPFKRSKMYRALMGNFRWQVAQWVKSKPKADRRRLLEVARGCFDA